MTKTTTSKLCLQWRAWTIRHPNMSCRCSRAKEKYLLLDVGCCRRGHAGPQRLKWSTQRPGQCTVAGFILPNLTGVSVGRWQKHLTERGWWWWWWCLNRKWFHCSGGIEVLVLGIESTHLGLYPLWGHGKGKQWVKAGPPQEQLPVHCKALNEHWWVRYRAQGYLGRALKVFWYVPLPKHLPCFVRTGARTDNLMLLTPVPNSDHRPSTQLE